jgi:DNA-binding NarL/FixJ family response regulator
MNIRVILADPHPVVREGLRHAVKRRGGKEIKIVGEASNGEAVLDISRKSPADVYILDASMPKLDGIATAAKLMRADPECKVIVLSNYDSRTLVEKAFRSGARGYVLKEGATDEMIQAIREVYKGRFFLSPAIAKYIVDGFIGKTQSRDGSDKPATLTKRETEILRLLAEGNSSKEIAKTLSIYLNTVHAHRRRIMHKLSIHKQADLIRYAIKEGIAEL